MHSYEDNEQLQRDPYHKIGCTLIGIETDFSEQGERETVGNLEGFWGFQSDVVHIELVGILPWP